jgi:hypothetical protein
VWSALLCAALHEHVKRSFYILTKVSGVIFCQHVRTCFADQVLQFNVQFLSCEDGTDEDAAKVVNAVTMYTAVGQALRSPRSKEDEVPLQRAVDIVYGEASSTKAKPFIVLDGSSGVGKTQQAFALAGFNVIYMLLHTWEGGLLSPQPIYRAFNEVSDEIRRCVTADIQTEFVTGRRLQYCVHNGSVTTNGLNLMPRNTKLQTTGLIYALFEHFTCPGRFNAASCLKEQTSAQFDLPYKPRTIAELKTLVQGSGDHRTVFMLDEFPSKGILHSTFIRSIFRVCGLVVILAGANSSVLNVLNPAPASRPGEEELWAVFVSTPLTPTPHSLTAALGEKVLSFQELTWFKELALQSRPLLAVLLVEAALKLENPLDANLDDLLDAVALGLKRKKSTHSNLYGVLGTWRSFECASMVFSLGKPTAEGNLIVSHFALVQIRGVTDDKPMKDPVSIVNDNGHLKLKMGKHEKESKHFVLECFFPPPSEDPLFHLTIHGTRCYPPFLNQRGDHTSTAYAALCVLKNPQLFALLPTQSLCSINTRADKSNGSELEVLVVNSAVAASRGGGVGGSSLDAFVGRMLAHSTTPTKDASVTSKDLLVNSLSKFLKSDPGVCAGQVPLLFAPSPKRLAFPEHTCDVNRAVLELGCMGQLLRPPDEVGMDGLFLHSSSSGGHCIDVFLEAKDYKAPLAVGMLSQCIVRAHSQVCRQKCSPQACKCARVLFIFCNAVSRGAFSVKLPVSIRHKKKTVMCTTKILVATRNAKGLFKLVFLNDKCKSLSAEKEDLVVVVVPLKEFGTEVAFEKDKPEDEEYEEVLGGGGGRSASVG